MNRRAILLLAAALFQSVPCLAQTTFPVAAPQPEPGLYEFKHLDGESIQAVAVLADSLFNVLVNYTPPLRVVVIRPQHNAAPDWRDKTIDFFKRYDVAPPPEPQVHYVAYLIRASNAKPEREDFLGSNPRLGLIPKQLDDAIAEMKSSLIYARYDLLATVTSVSQGSASASDTMPIPDYAYTIEYANVAVAPDHKSVTIRPFRFVLHHLAVNSDSSISSTVTVREGQKLVLGKVRMSGDSDVFVVLTVKAE